MPRAPAAATKRSRPTWGVGTRISKRFGDDFYPGDIRSYDADHDYYHIVYEDGDEEDLDTADIEEQVDACDLKILGSPKKKPKKTQKTHDKTVSLGEEKKDDDVIHLLSDGSDDPEMTVTTVSSTSPPEAAAADDNANVSTSRRGRRRKSVQSYRDVYSTDEEEDEDDDEEEQQAPRRRGRVASSAKSSKKTHSQAKSNNDDSDFDSVIAIDDDDESLDVVNEDSDDDVVIVDDTDDDDVLEVTDTRKKPTKKRGGGGRKDQKSAPKATAEKKEGKTSMAEAFKPINYPLYDKKSLETIYEEHEFLDPCGMEATDDVIDHLVGDQVLKIGKLLQRTLENPQYKGSTAANPLQLGTACSGTDAPALALTIVQEQMERFQWTQSLHCQHQFSCEKEPFKQSYLARNFDSVLYPDIVKLTDEKPRDVYGRQTEIPPFNLFVAGTSCKNFSLLHSTKRLDIEDKGCSGETFLSAVELLFQKQPDFCIFENVIGAPWAKMQEYVTGRVKLSTVYDKEKAIQKTSAKDTRIKELKFALDGDDIIATEIPMQVGVRCGSTVKGFAVPGQRKLVEARFPPKQRECTLPQLLKANPDIDEENDTLVFETGECTYCTSIQKVDTKLYGLPQTRQRTYMFVWKPDDPEIFNDDLGLYWQAIVTYLQNPVRHALDAFILDTDHDNIRVLREALNGPPGRHTKRSVFQEIDFFTSGNANVKHNVLARQKSGMELMSRPNVEGGERGKKQVPPHYWLEYMDIQPQRELDMLDILHISAARDAETHDSNHSSFFWNISQNVSKEKHRTSTPGIAGCISPGGEFFVTNLGRPLLGSEKLLLQGIPYFRLALGSETEVELGDLAGNAMSLTVVCATMLAALTCHQLRQEFPLDTDYPPEVSKADTQRKKDIEKIHKYLSKKGCIDNEKTIILPSEAPSFEGAVEARTVFNKFAALASDAINSSVWCTCETSGRNSKPGKESQVCAFMHCPTCRISCCSNCIGSHSGYQLKSHSLEEKRICVEAHSNQSFVSKLRNIAPASIYFDEEGIRFIAKQNDDDIHRVEGLWKAIFNLEKIKRHRHKWILHYNARDNNGVGEVVAEFRITIGELWTESQTHSSGVDVGMKGELISFFPAKTQPLVPGKLEPCAIVVVKGDTCEWLVRKEPSFTSIEVVGSEPCKSFRSELGLTDDAAEQVQHYTETTGSKKYQASKKIGEGFRWRYPENWKEWPSVINITAGQFSEIDGEYKRVACRQTTNQSALWIRSAASGEDPLYIILKPNVGRTGPDFAVISKSIAWDDFAAILVAFPVSWNPSNALLEKHFSQEVEKYHWDPVEALRCFVPKSSINVQTEKWEPPNLLSVKGLSETQISMLYPFENNAKSSDTITLNVHSGLEAQKVIRAFNYLCVPPILQHVAHSEHLASQLAPSGSWTELSREDGDPMFGFCNTTIPQRPAELWEYDTERQSYIRKSRPEESRQYYQKLQAAPKAFKFTLNKKLGNLEISYYPDVAAHHAARFLLEGRGDRNLLKEGLKVTYRLSDIAQQCDPEFSPFKVYACSDEMPTEVGLKEPFQLYERQQKVVTKMSMIEQGNVEYEELEMSEHEMPGSTGFSLISKASRNRSITGGVIADAIGAGKTVISIALIVQGLKEARASRSFPRRTSASLVVVPDALVSQWKSEIEKFTTGVNVLCIYETKDILKTSVQQILEADVVICTVDILQIKGYTDNLTTKSGLAKNKDDTMKKIPELPKNMGQQEKPGINGVWVPATSQDPYGRGANNEMKSQKLRELSAYFTHSYLEAVKLVREKDFKKTDKGVPLEYFEWERIVVDEIHECLCTDKDNLQLDYFKEKNRRASRELLGITQKNVSERPLVYRKSIFGLTGTPLLDNSSRVIELANLIGCTYVIGLASHWRKLERESRRDIFLQHFLEPKQSREIRQAIYSKCQEYLKVACCRNTTEKELEGIEKMEENYPVSMSEEEKQMYLDSQHGLERRIRSLSVRPENFDPSAGHDISKFLRQNVYLPSRGKALVEICKKILAKDETTKIVVFADGRIGAGLAVREFLDEAGLGCTYLDPEESVETRNEKISYYQRPDATKEDRERPRVLVLHFDHAAGLNLQKECYNLIMFNPLYVGDGGTTGDPVSDASTEQQAIGRVFRPGQLRPEVHVYRIEVRGPNGEECLDGCIIRRNTDTNTLAATTNAAEEEY